jgi:hypothetical protein
MASTLGYRPDSTKARLCFYLQPDSYDSDSLITVLDQLKSFYAPATRSRWCGMGYQSTGATRCAPSESSRMPGSREPLPAYAPELNPGRIPMGQPQQYRAGQLHRRPPGRGRRPGPAWHPPGLQESDSLMDDDQSHQVRESIGQPGSPRVDRWDSVMVMSASLSRTW